MTAYQARPPRVVLIDEDVFLAGIYARHLRDAGWDVDIACTGDDGVRLVQSRPDAILMDVLLHRGDGFALLERFTSDSGTSGVPVFILTCLGQRQDIDRCRQLGAAGYMMKMHQGPEDVVRCLAPLCRLP